MELSAPEPEWWDKPPYSAAHPSQALPTQTREFRGHCVTHE